jgi:hypothetical protein
MSQAPSHARDVFRPGISLPFRVQTHHEPPDWQKEQREYGIQMKEVHGFDVEISGHGKAWGRPRDFADANTYFRVEPGKTS